jgi:hypothetical protein
MRTKWRNAVCGGCFRECCYRNFRVFKGNAFAEVQQELWVSSEDPEDWKYKSRGVVLGRMHAIKREAWKHHTDNCPHWGEEDESSSP